MSRAKKFVLGEVVRARVKLNNAQTVVSYGVIVRVPDDLNAGYRVRISTHSFTDYIEIGAQAYELSRKGDA